MTNCAAQGVSTPNLRICENSRPNFAEQVVGQQDPRADAPASADALTHRTSGRGGCECHDVGEYPAAAARGTGGRHSGPGPRDSGCLQVTPRAPPETRALAVSGPCVAILSADGLCNSARGAL